MAKNDTDLGDLFGTIKIDEELSRRTRVTEGDSTLSAAQARKKVRELLSKGLTDRDALEISKVLAEQIVQSIPDDVQMTAKFFDSVDLRVYIDKALKSGWVAERNTEGRQAGLDRLMAHQQESVDEFVKERAIAGGASEGQETSATRKLRQIPGMVTFNAAGAEGVNAAAPPETVTDPNTGEQVVVPGGGTGNPLDYDPTADMFGSSNEPAPQFPEADWKALIDVPQSAFDQIINAEIQFNEDAGTPGMMRTGIVFDSSQGGATSSSTVSKKMMSLSAILDMPNTLTYEEVTSLQGKLASAGYFDRVGAAPIEGDPHDEATQKAWELALIDAYRNQSQGPGANPNNGVIQMLAKKGAEYRNVVRERNRNRFGKFDNDLVRASADSMAIELLGRPLDDQQFAKIRDELLAQREDRSDDITGVDDMSWARSEDAATFGFTADDINSRIMRDFSAERKVNAGQNFFQALYKTMGADFPMPQPDPSKRVTIPNMRDAGEAGAEARDRMNGAD